MTSKKQRLTMMIFSLILISVGLFFLFQALGQSIVYFDTPAQALDRGPTVGQRLRIGGLVEPGSLSRDDNGHLSFRLIDGQSKVTVTYAGLVPDLFEPGQGAVAEGFWQDHLGQGHLQADRVLAKHDETYMPANVTQALAERGYWNSKDKDIPNDGQDSGHGDGS